MWDVIDAFTERLSVPGGWIVRSSYVHKLEREGSVGVSVTCHQIFVADAMHDWTLPVAPQARPPTAKAN